MQNLFFNWQRHLSALGNNALLGYMSLLALQVKVLWGAWYNWDLPLWDGATYFIYGRQVVSDFRFPPFEWSPLFAGYYAIFQALFTDAVPFIIYFAHRYVAIVLVLVLFYALLRTALSPVVAWLLAAYFFLLPVGLANHFVVHLFVLIPLLAAYRMSLSKSVYANGFILVGLLLAAFVRSEFVLSFAIVLVVFILNDYALNKGNGLPIGQWLRPYTPLLIVGIMLVPMIVRFGPSHIPVDRAWGAFMQHYAWGYQERHPEWNVDFWFRYSEAVQQSFGDATSIAEAAVRNPSAMVAHLFWNLGLLPEAIVTALTPFADFGWTQILIGLGLMGWLRAVVAADRRSFLWHRYSTVSDSALLRACFLKTSLPLHLAVSGRSRRQVLDGFRISKQALRVIRFHKLWFVILCSLLPLAVSSLVVRPRPIYLMPLFPFVFLVAGIGLDSVLERYSAAKWIKWALPLMFVILIIIFPSPFSMSTERPITTIAESLKRSPVEGTYSLLGPSARGFCVYSVPEKCLGVEIYQVPADESSFERFLHESNIRVIIVNDQLASNVPPRGRAFVAELQADPDKVGWQAFDNVGVFDIYTLADK